MWLGSVSFELQCPECPARSGSGGVYWFCLAAMSEQLLGASWPTLVRRNLGLLECVCVERNHAHTHTNAHAHPSVCLP